MSGPDLPPEQAKKVLGSTNFSCVFPAILNPMIVASIFVHCWSSLRIKARLLIINAKLWSCCISPVVWSDVWCDIVWALSLTFSVSMIHLLLAEPCNVKLTSPTGCTQWRYLWCPVVGPASMNLALKWPSWTQTSWTHGGDVAVRFGQYYCDAYTK